MRFYIYSLNDKSHRHNTINNAFGVESVLIFIVNQLVIETVNHTLVLFAFTLNTFFMHIV